MAELLLKIDPDLYSKYLICDGKKTVMYAELEKALYGTLDMVLLFWKDLSAKLESWGYERNLYDWCVVNKVIDSKQCTILWHVDDLKILHVNSSVVDNVLCQLDAEYRSKVPIMVTRGKVHDYLGMMIDYSEEGKVKILMVDYIEKMVADLPADMDGTAPTPAANHLFKVNTVNPKRLEPQMADMFHHNVVKLLFLCNRSRPDIQMSVAFLCTRVKEPDYDDYKKLAQTMKYLCGTKYLPLILQ